MAEIKNILSEASGVVSAICIFVSIVISIIAVGYKVKSNFVKRISEFISSAEEFKGMNGSDKMYLVVTWVKNLIPRIFRVVFNDATLEQIAQNIYNDMKKYALLNNSNSTLSANDNDELQSKE